MIKKLVAAALLALAPFAVSAATIQGQLDISGAIDISQSNFSATGGVVFADATPTSAGGNAYVATAPTGAFATTLSQLSDVQMTNIDFTSPGMIYLAGGFTFTATAFYNVVSTTIGGVTIYGFGADGILSGNGYTDTLGFMSFSSQNPATGGNVTNVSFSATTIVPLPAAGFLLLGGLGGLAMMKRRKKA